MKISLIYARSENHCIGRDGQLPWKLPEEYAHFLRVTRGNAVIMGRRTYEENNSELQGCRNIVVSRSDKLVLPANVSRAGSLPEALSLCVDLADKVFVIGGVSLYREALPKAQEVYETVVMADLEGDTYIDAFDFTEWTTEQVKTHGVDASHAFAFTVFRHRRSRVTAGQSE
ncbi:dihydrofolate reductase [Seongchinamella unica]|uniref:dihydrofolate reductase n=1 Tax=Seongchinamella unica TaxID=2547392 RepID=UPI0014042964|nr:dihydrofolate reductase [Seongchinamella unica]